MFESVVILLYLILFFNNVKILCIINYITETMLVKNQFITGITWVAKLEETITTLLHNVLN